MKTLCIEGQLINLEKFHFTRRESSQSLLVSFGTDFVRFTGNKEKIDLIHDNILNAIDE